MTTLESGTSVDAAGEPSRQLSWLDHPTCEELAWLDTLRRRVVSRPKPESDVAGESPADHALRDSRVLKHR